MESVGGREVITGSMSVEEIVDRYPEAVAVFERYGFECAGCRAALFGNVKQGAEVHGIDADALLVDLNVAASGR